MTILTGGGAGGAGGRDSLAVDLDASDLQCADVDKQRAEADLRRFLPQSIASATAPSTAPDRAHPTTYIICERDQAIPPAAQEQMAAAADHRHRLPSSHQPMTSMPDELADALGRFH
jgi:pimeloyl-ACP methyl ester carboxylesterase